MRNRDLALGLLMGVVAGTLFLFPAYSLAQEVARSLLCTQESGTHANWMRGSLNTGIDDSPELDLVFDAIDLTTGRARLIGNNSAVDVLVFSEQGVLHFTEVNDRGSFVLSSVFLGKATSDGRIPFVTSRHVILLGEPSIGQYLGSCEVFGF